jgi:hypothetical protein
VAAEKHFIGGIYPVLLTEAGSNSFFGTMNPE